MVLTTTSITAVSVSMRSDQSILRSPETIQGNTGTRASCAPKPTCTKAIQDRIIAIIRQVVVISSDVREPAAAGAWPCSSWCGWWMTPPPRSSCAWIWGAWSPAPSSLAGGGPSPGQRARAPASEIKAASTAPSRGRKTMAWYIIASALHQIDVFDRDRALAAVEDHQNREPDGGFRRRHREHQQRVDLTDDVAEMSGEGDQVDIDREQDQFDRHQDDDDVLAVEEDAEDPEREQDGADREIMSEPDRHALPPSPCPGRTCRISIDISGVRAFCTAMFCRRTRTRCCSVSTMAPTMETSRIMPAASKK